MNAIVSRLADIVGDAILTDVQVSGVTPVAPGFIRVTLHDQGFADKRWSPGDKLQLRPYRGSLSLRTYTPIAWDNANATTQLIGWATDHGPGGRWFGEVADRDTCSVFGPRRSVELGKTGDEVVFVGDESTIGLACVVRDLRPDAPLVFEAVDPGALAAALDALGFGERVVVAKDEDRTLLLEQVREAAASRPGPVDVVAGGDAATVRAVRSSVRSWPSAPRRVHGKPYWSEGRSGLD
ncbi:oxidoreductase [Gordonia pseudamarae]|jgi:ferric-chelate reductase (NADPH)|uniref:Oxidoreductase n=1 Tax=Gordonia pseudamarae TaxID=2831662 RepID=A0ABX6IFD8_9ACTN|nr:MULTISPECIES: oxidoreductase [Gordonia]MBD0023372.1 oxidoreductase [Gordonia sp. (in: high G+C Gram-positive bacteria)]QHN25591.1 oxidoreductase [Gordonia pseudamarae]QHN34523.1 oxidoreductase [Gordonia pseudamarae]